MGQYIQHIFRPCQNVSHKHRRMKYRIVHKTTYKYKYPVWLGIMWCISGTAQFRTASGSALRCARVADHAHARDHDRAHRLLREPGQLFTIQEPQEPV